MHNVYHYSQCPTVVPTVTVMPDPSSTDGSPTPITTTDSETMTASSLRNTSMVPAIELTNMSLSAVIAGSIVGAVVVIILIIIVAVVILVLKWHKQEIRIHESNGDTLENAVYGSKSAHG